MTISLCTHLGCIPTYAPEPGSAAPGAEKFDLGGRVYKGSPASTNLVIPPHRLSGESRLVIGVDATETPA